MIHRLDLRKIALYWGKSERAKTVLSEGKVTSATLREEKQFLAVIFGLETGELCVSPVESIDHFLALHAHTKRTKVYLD